MREFEKHPQRPQSNSPAIIKRCGSAIKCAHGDRRSDAMVSADLKHVEHLHLINKSFSTKATLCWSLGGLISETFLAGTNAATSVAVLPYTDRRQAAALAKNLSTTLTTLLCLSISSRTSALRGCPSAPCLAPRSAKRLPCHK